MTELLGYAVRGIPIGCVFAIMAIGIVLTYKSSGVLNLAFGAQAFAAAGLFYVLRAEDGRHWPMLPALVVSLAVAGPLLGWVLDKLLYRHLRTATPLTKLVTSLGLLVAIPQIVRLDFLLGAGPKLRPPSIASDEVVTFGQFALYHYEIATILATVVLVAALGVLFRWTPLGLMLRAVVESPRLTELNGIDADRVGSFSWMLSSFLAALAGVLIAPLFAQVTDLNFFTLLVAALAAAAFGRLSSIPLTLLGGITLGVTQALLAGYLPQNNVLSTGLRPSLPFVALFLLLLFWPGLRRQTEHTDPLAGVDPPPAAPPAEVRTRRLTIATRTFAVVFIAGSTLVSIFVLNEFWLTIIIRGVVLGLIFLSFTVLTGLGGQISLCQASFAAVGAFATAQIVQQTNMAVLVAMVIGAFIAALVGLLIALPALRLGGIHLALATLAFALMFEAVIRPLDIVSGGAHPPKVPRPLVAGIDFANNKAFLLLCIALLALFSVAVLLVRGGTTGRFLDALRGSETAAVAIGIDPARAKITAFALSAFIAGFGGGLLASFEGRVNYEANFNYYFGLVWLVLVITLGARSVQAAINAGLSFLLFPRLLDLLLSHLPGIELENTQTLSLSLSFILFGLGAITYARHPEGIIDAQTRRIMARVTRSTTPSTSAKRDAARATDLPRDDRTAPAVAAGTGGGA